MSEERDERKGLTGYQIADFILRFRLGILIFIVISTAYFAYEALTIKIGFDFNKLLPENQPYVKVYKEVRELFGGANVVTIMVSVKEGDIFNLETLGKVQRITRAMYYLNNVNNYQIFSIAQRKIKDVKATEAGLESKPIMWPDLPKDEKEIEELRNIIYSNDLIIGNLVSLDGTAALITADFFERNLDYKNLYRSLEEIRKKEEDANHNISIIGEPMVYGNVWRYLPQTQLIFIITFIGMAALLYLYTRKRRFVFIPLLSGLGTSIWGLGIAHIRGYDLDPLMLVLPLLISARSLSHSVQLNERFAEEYVRLKDVKEATRHTIATMFEPGLSGVVCDAAAIISVALVPIPFIRIVSYMCFFWALSTIPFVLFFNPVILSYLRPPRETEMGRTGVADRLLMRLSGWAINKTKTVLVTAVIVGVIAIWLSEHVPIGDAHPGTPILWPWSRYNQDVAKINEKFLANERLYVVFRGKDRDAMADPEVLERMQDLMRHMETNPNVGACFAFTDLIRGINTCVHEGNPKWKVLPETKREIGMLFYMYSAQGEPGDLDRFVDFEYRNGNVMVFCKDHQGATIRSVIDHIKTFMKSKPPMENAEIVLAGGLLGVLAGINEVLGGYQTQLLVVALAVTAIFCWITFKSLTAGILLIIPLTLANFIVFAYMTIRGIGINVNTLPLASNAIGIGVDYGIYLLSRIREEYKVSQNWGQAISTAVVTTGKAVSFTALTIAVGVIFWNFSSLRFNAEMGLLLSIVTFFHLVGTIVLLSALVMVVKPKFISHGRPW